MSEDRPMTLEEENQFLKEELSKSYQLFMQERTRAEAAEAQLAGRDRRLAVVEGALRSLVGDCYLAHAETDRHGRDVEATRCALCVADTHADGCSLAGAESALAAEAPQAAPTVPECLRSLSEEELAAAPKLTDEQIRDALAKGAEERRAAEQRRAPRKAAPTDARGPKCEECNEPVKADISAGTLLLGFWCKHAHQWSLDCDLRDRAIRAAAEAAQRVLEAQAAPTLEGPQRRRPGDA